MFLPIGDTPNPRNFTAWINGLLIATNVAVYALVSLPLSYQPADLTDPALQAYLQLLAELQPSAGSIQDLLRSVSAYDLFVFVHGFKPAAPSLQDLFASMFLHGGGLHLAGNMLFLWIYGNNVEHRLGRLRYLLAYLGTGLFSTAFFASFARESMMPMVGASGAISGVLGLYFLFFPRNQVKVFVFLFPILFNVILLPARWVLGFYLIADNLLPFVLGAESSVAYGAHIGGFIGGLGVAWAGERMARRRPRTSAIAPEPGALETTGPKECVRLAQQLVGSGDPGAAVRLLRRCIAANPRSGALAEVHLMLGLIYLSAGQPTTAYQYLQSVFDHEPDPVTAERARSALEQIDVYRRTRH